MRTGVFGSSDTEGKSSGFSLVRRNGVEICQADILSPYPGLAHGFSTRAGGASSGCFESMNLGPGRGDDPQAVQENFKLFCAAVGVSPENLVLSRQVHKDHVAIVTASDRGNGFLRENRFDAVNGADALITDQPEVALMLFFADCVPIFLYDPVKRVIGLVHAGWRGTVLRIVGKTVRKMETVFGCNPTDMVAAIGPSIRVCCFETGADVETAVRALGESFSDAIVAGTGSAEAAAELCETETGSVVTGACAASGSGTPIGKYHIDLPKLNKKLLIAAGLREGCIADAGWCTMCQPDRFFSHRKMGTQRGNMAALLQLQ